ncbi:MAG: M3 family oligoendopeptidase [Clostridia bacterium]|nr:M3 family oligoendopeptidase [Clostridia bacterium]
MKETTWDLSVYYTGFDAPAFRRDISDISHMVEKGHELLKSSEGPAGILEKMIRALEALTDKLYRVYSFCQLTLATDAQNIQALKCQDEIGVLMVDVEVLQSACARYIGTVEGLEAIIDGSLFLQDYGFILRESREKAAHMLPESMERWMLRMSLSGGDAFGKLRNQLMGTHTVEIDGMRLPLSAVRGMAYDPDPSVRKRAYDAEIVSYQKVELPMAFCLAGIKGEALTLCEAKNYQDVLTQQLVESRMDRETLEAMLSAVREALPDFRRYLKAKGKLLGHREGLPFYDLFAPVSQAKKRFTVMEARTLLTDVFSGAHPEMGAFIDRAFANRWIDLYPREGKEGGAFCAHSHGLKLSRILTNFVGSFSDVSTLAHELGHAWHGHCMEAKPVLMAEEPMALAETASIFNETLLNHTLRKIADADDAFAMLESSLMDATQTVVDIYSRFIFECAVFEARKTYIPSSEELKAMMLDAQEETYGDSLAQTARHPYMWICKPHYYSVGLHFYNFPYTFGLLFGLGVFARYQAMGGAFMRSFDELLAACGSDLVANVAAGVGIDVHSVEYWRGALNVIRKEIDEFVALVERRGSR